MVDAQMIKATIIALEQSWLRDRNELQAKAFAQALEEYPWERIFDDESLWGPRCKGIAFDLEGESMQAIAADERAPCTSGPCAGALLRTAMMMT